MKKKHYNNIPDITGGGGNEGQWGGIPKQEVGFVRQYTLLALFSRLGVEVERFSYFLSSGISSVVPSV